MFGWLRKSSKEASANDLNLQQNAMKHIQPQTYVHIDDRVRPKTHLDQSFENIDDQKKDVYSFRRPHSVTAARPFFEATKHLDQQQIKKDIIQTNYLSDNENKGENENESSVFNGFEENNEHNSETNDANQNETQSEIVSENKNESSHENNRKIESPQTPSEQSTKNVIRSFQQRPNEPKPTNESTQNHNSTKPQKSPRGFAKRESKSNNLQRRRSSVKGKKNRSFTPQSVENIQNTVATKICQEIIGSPNLNIQTWLQNNALFFANGNKGEQLLQALMDSGIENPIHDLAILSAYPDLYEIADMAQLNILERRKFINAAYANSASERKENKTGKNIVVMSTEEQESLARMDSIISQLQQSRNMIKKRIVCVSNGAVEYERIIKSEFEILRTLLSQREQQLIDEMKYRVTSKITQLTELDYDLISVLEQCQKSKISAQKLMKTNEQPRVSREKWRVLMARKKKVINVIEETVHQYIVNHTNRNINQLIVHTMAMKDIMPTLPQPLLEQYGIDRYPHHHKRHYDILNNYFLTKYTKNFEQIHLELSIAGFAFSYRERNKMHKLLSEYGLITDVEEQLKRQLGILFPHQFDQSNSNHSLTHSNPYTKSINLSQINDKNKKETLTPVKPENNNNNIPPQTVTSAGFVLINPEDWDQQMSDKKKRKKKKENKTWTAYGTLQINIELSHKEQNEWELIDRKLVALNEKRQKRIRKLNKFNSDRFNEIQDFEEKETFRLQKFFADIVGGERSDVVSTERIKEIEIQIAMKRKSKIEMENANENINDFESFGWISMGWLDLQSIKSNKTDAENKTEFEDFDNGKLKKVLNIPFQSKKQFQELMTQTFLASLELEMMTEREISKQEISKQEIERVVFEQLSNDELFEFSSRNIDEFEKNFLICVRTRCRDRINVKMANMRLPPQTPDIVNKNKEIVLPLQVQSKSVKPQKETKEQQSTDDSMGEMRECDLIVFQSSFCPRKLISFSLLRPTLVVLAEKKKKLDSKYVNGFVSIVGHESLQFIDPISGQSAILSRILPPDSDQCGLLIDFIRLKQNTNDIDTKGAINDDSLTSRLRNAGKRLSVVRIGGSHSDEANERVLSGRLDIYNICMDKWTYLCELEPKRELMAVAMFYGRACVTGGKLKTAKAINVCEEFSFSERKWKTLQSMNIGRYGHCMCTFGNKPTQLFVYGGEMDNGDWTHVCETYNPQLRQWRKLNDSAKHSRYGAQCCVWKGYGIVVCGGLTGKSSQSSENSKSVELFNTASDNITVSALRDTYFEHGLFPAVWCDSDDNCIYVASQFVIVDHENKEETLVTYRVEMLDHPNKKWRVLKSDNNRYFTQNAYQIAKSSSVWSANAIRRTIGATINCNSA